MLGEARQYVGNCSLFPWLPVPQLPGREEGGDSVIYMYMHVYTRNTVIHVHVYIPVHDMMYTCLVLSVQ